MSSVYVFRLKHGTAAISIFHLLFWLFSLGEYKNLPAWNSHLREAAGGLHAVLSSC